MSRRRIYQRIKGHWNYCHILPDGMFYIGRSGEDLVCKRWKPSNYKNVPIFYKEIQKYGWENIKHIVLKDGLTKEQSKELEKLLIQEASKGGWCLNVKCSFVEEPREQHRERCRQYYQEHKEELLKKKKHYIQEHREEHRERCRQYYQEHKEELLKKSRLYRQEHKKTKLR